MYALVDCNNFYVSCERVFQPHLQGKPVVVLSNNDGCIISRSEEAKALGIAMGAPEFKVRELLQKNNVAVFSSNYTLYGDLSNRVMSVLRQFTPHIENYSIDEAFLNLQGIQTHDYTQYSLTIRKRILKWLGLPVCVGVAPTKALSKIANRVAKKFPDRTQGVYVIDTDEKRIKALRWTKIEDVWGIGRRFSKKMIARNILTAYDFTKPEHEAYIQRVMGVIGKRLRNELLGISVLTLEDAVAEKKTIAVTRSFKTKLKELPDLKERISTFATVCAEKLRQQNSCCGTLTVFLTQTQNEEKFNRLYYSHTENLPFASNSSLTLSQVAISLLEKIHNPKLSYAKAGVIVSQLSPQNQKQLHLFVEENPKHQKLMEAIDRFHQKTGQRKIKLGNQNLQHTWLMKQNHLSPNYTTNLNDIITVKC